MADVPASKRAMARLRRLKVGDLVVMSNEAGRAGLNVTNPVGRIVRFGELWSITIRKLGQRKPGDFSAIFWQPMPKRLRVYLRARPDKE